MKILIVDDDEMLVEKIVSGLDWTGLGVGMTFTANNIRQAKKILQKYPIQLLITDIEMPRGSGLELVHWVQENKLDCKCIIISSYASFAYAQEAIRLQTSQYLLKPISNEELSRVVGQIINLSKRNKMAEEAKQKENFWSKYLESCRQGTAFTGSVEYVGGLYGQEDTFFTLLLKGGDRLLKKEQIVEMAQEAWKEGEAVCETVLHYGDAGWMLVGKSAGRESFRLAQLLATVLDQMAIKGYIFCSTERDCTLQDVYSALEELGKMSRKIVMGDSSLLDIAEWKNRRKPDIEKEYNSWKKEIQNADDCKALGESMIAFIERECREARMTNSAFEQFRLVVSQLIFLWLEQQKLQSFMFFSEEEFSSMYENSVHSLEDMRCFLRWIFQKMEGYRRTDTRREKVVKKIKAYIESHLSEELTRKELADVVYLSEDYVARMFNEETGISLSNYVAQRRMKKAQEYLLNTDWGIARIAMEVGYTNFSYFSKTFKEFVGCTPNEYRRKKIR